MKLFTIALNGYVLKGYQYYDVKNKLVKYQSMSALSLEDREQLLFNTFTAAEAFLKEISKDGTHIWIEDSIYLIEEFDIYEVDVSEKTLFITQEITNGRRRPERDFDPGSEDFNPYH